MKITKIAFISLCFLMPLSACNDKPKDISQKTHIEQDIASIRAIQTIEEQIIKIYEKSGRSEPDKLKSLKDQNDIVYKDIDTTLEYLKKDDTTNALEADTKTKNDMNQLLLLMAKAI